MPQSPPGNPASPGSSVSHPKVVLAPPVGGPSLGRGLRGLLLALLGVLLVGCASTPDKRVLQYLNTQGFGSRYTGDAEEENYVTIGDSFLWQNEFDPTLSGQASIDIDGTVYLEQVGSVHVAGMTRSELEAYLTLQLSRYFSEVDIVIRQLQTSGKSYFVFG